MISCVREREREGKRERERERGNDNVEHNRVNPTPLQTF